MARENVGDMIVTEPTLLADEPLPPENTDEDDCSSVEGQVIQPQIDCNYIFYHAKVSFYITSFT